MLRRALGTAKSAIQGHFPEVVNVYNRVYYSFVVRRRLRRMSVDAVFESIYRSNGWDGSESPCGPGSSLAATASIREALPKIAARLAIRRMLDIPCGDCNWMSQLTLKLDQYIGADIVSDLIAKCAARHPANAETKREFQRLDILVDSLPAVDLIFCRDCLVHFSFADIRRALANIRESKSTYLLTTTYPGRQNSDIFTGEWRPLDLQAKPFCFPPPIILINERCTVPPGCSDKSMGLWRIVNLPQPSFLLSA